MVISVVADVNAERHLDALLLVCAGPQWRDVWTAIGARVRVFGELGLNRDLPDDELWAFCQANQIVLITANRNSKGPTSLEQTIRSRNTERSLPVLTLADPGRILNDRAYAQWVAEEMIDILLDIDNVRGCGRLYLPRSIETMP